MNVKLGCCNICLPGGGTFAAELIRMAGLDGMSLDLGYQSEGFPLMSQTLIDMYRDAAARNGIAISNIGCSCYDFIPLAPEKGTEEYDLSIRCLKAAIHAADQLDARVVMVPMFGVSRIQTQADFDRTVAIMREACDLAAEKGVTMAAENVLPPQRQIEMVRQVDRPNFGLFYDSQNFFYNEGMDQLAVLKELYPYLVPVLHVKDGTETTLSASILGEGTSGFHAVMDYLKEKNFQGWIINENYYNKPPLRQLDIDPVAVFLKDSAVLRQAAE